MEIPPPSKKDEAEPSQTRAVAKPLRRLRYHIAPLPEPHDRMPLEEVLEWKRKAQITDHPEDWIRVAYCVSIGVGKVPPDSKERETILSRPKVGQWASQNMHQSRWAAYAMGMILFYGLGEYNKDDVASNDAFEVGYRKKCPLCTNNLAICYRDGDGVEKDARRAVEILQEAILYDSLMAMLILGELSAKGCGVEQDCCKAFQLFSNVAEHWLIGVLYKALCFEKGIGVDKDLQEAMDLYQQASDAGYHSASYYLACLLLNGDQEEKEKAVTIFERGVQGGNADCMCYLGALYMDGNMVPKDEIKGYSLFQQAASLGDAQAYRFMAKCNEGGHGVPWNERRAVELYEKAAALQDVEAMRVLGISYVKGRRGQLQDVSRGLVWLRQAAQKNDAEAIRILSTLYFDGEVVPKDENKAHLLLERAFDLDDPRNEWLKKNEAAAALQSARTMKVLGQSYMQESRVVGEDALRDFKWPKRAADKNKAEAIQSLKFLEREGKEDLLTAVSFLKIGTELGDVADRQMLDDNFRDGKGAGPDTQYAVWMLTNASLKGNGLANLYLGKMYEFGYGVDKDLTRAHQIYQEGVSSGNSQCMEILARSHLSDAGAPKDEVKALQAFYTHFADVSEDTDCLLSFAFASVYASDGLPQDYELAFKLFTKAANLGSVGAVDNMAYLFRTGCGVSASITQAKILLQRAIGEWKYPNSLFQMAEILASSSKLSDLQRVRAVIAEIPETSIVSIRAQWLLPFVDAQVRAFKLNQFGWTDELRPDFVLDSDLQIAARIGWGAFGNVFLARFRRKCWVAVKLLRVDMVKDKAWAATHALHERFTCRVLDTKNIRHMVKYIGFVDDFANDQRGLIFGLCADIRSVEAEAERCVKTFVSVRFQDRNTVPDWSKRVESSLRSMVVHAESRHFSNCDVIVMLANVADAVSAIHKLGYLHRDIADRNVLCDHHGNVQLADFGLAKYVGRGVNSYDPDDPINKYAKNMTPGHPYAVAWWPRECVGTGKYKAIFSVSSDVYSFGVLIWQCFTGHDPFDEVEARSSDVADREAAVKRIIQKIRKYETPNLTLLYPDTPEGLRDLLERCWLSDPDRRPSMADVAAELRRIHDQPVPSRGHAQTITSWNDATSKWFNFQTYWDIPMEELQNLVESSSSTSDSAYSTYPEKVHNQRLSEVKHEESPADALDDAIISKLHHKWRPFDLFIVHTGKQKDLEVATLKDHYEMCGFRCFVDYEMSGADGSNTEYMSFALATCRYALVVLSKEFLGNPDPCAELMFAFQRMNWLREQKAGGWESMWVVLYKISLKSYKKIYQTRRDQLPNDLGSDMTLYIYPNKKCRDWAILYNKIKNEMVVHDTAGNAIKRWQQFLTQFPDIRSLEPPFSSLGTLYNTEATEQNS